MFSQAIAQEQQLRRCLSCDHLMIDFVVVIDKSSGTNSDGGFTLV